MSYLKAENLTYVYSKKTAFRKDAVTNVSFEAERGEIIAIIGHTGSGKSTLVQMLNGLIQPDNGTVYLNGQDIYADKKQISKFRYRIGLVFQYPEYQLFEDTVYKDISYGPTNMGLSAEEIKERVLESTDIVGLERELLDKSPFDLSGGQKRRAAIAGVIAMRPEVIIFDEPTAGLDPKGRDTIFDMIKRYCETYNAVVIIVSHSMEDVAKIADKVVVLNKGNLVAFDDTKNVFNQGKMLESIGLDVPQITDVFNRLKSLGADVPTDVFTVEDAVNVVLQLKRKDGEQL